MDPEKNRDNSSEMVAEKRNPEGNGEGVPTQSPQSPEMGSNRCLEMSLEEDLHNETLKWLEKAEVLFCQISGEEHFRDNVSAYIRDSHYFLEKKDLIRAFEAVIWAWAWMEIGLEKDLLQQKE